VSRVVAASIAIAMAACTVADVDLTGKQCPCAAGWTCETASNTCVRDPSPIDASDTAIADAIDGPIDAPAIDAPDGAPPPIDAMIDAPTIDAPPGPSCLGSAPGASLYADDFADLIGWVNVGGTWSAAGNEAVQSSTAALPSYLYPAGTGAFTSYRVTARMRRLGGAAAGAMALGARLQTGNDAQYHCGWEPGTGGLRLQWIRNNGTPGGTLAQTVIDLGSIPGFDPAAPVTMELQVQGSQLTCCLREIAGATVTVADTRYTLGAPSLRTTSQSAAFGDFHVYAP